LRVSLLLFHEESKAPLQQFFSLASSDASHPFDETWCSRLGLSHDTSVHGLSPWFLSHADYPLHVGDATPSLQFSFSLVSFILFGEFSILAKPCALAFQFLFSPTVTV
jgi:hypothetical protein